MPVEIITKDDLNHFRIQLLDDLKKIIQPKIPPQKEWLKSAGGEKNIEYITRDFANPAN